MENLPEEVRTPHGRDSAADTHMPFPLHFPVAGGGGGGTHTSSGIHPPVPTAGIPPGSQTLALGQVPGKAPPPPATNPPRITLRGRRGGGGLRAGGPGSSHGNVA